MTAPEELHGPQSVEPTPDLAKPEGLRVLPGDRPSMQRLLDNVALQLQSDDEIQGYVVMSGDGEILAERGKSVSGHAGITLLAEDVLPALTPVVGSGSWEYVTFEGVYGRSVWCRAHGLLIGLNPKSANYKPEFQHKL